MLYHKLKKQIMQNKTKREMNEEGGAHWKHVKVSTKRNADGRTYGSAWNFSESELKNKWTKKGK